MFFIVSLILSILITIFFLVMFFTLSSHFEKMSLPEENFQANSKAMKIYKTGGVALLILMFLFLILTFY